METHSALQGHPPSYTDIAQAPAGRDLDALVHALVFGQETQTLPFHTSLIEIKQGLWTWTRCERCGAESDDPGDLMRDQRCTPTIPPYSTDMTMAWRLVMYCGSRFWLEQDAEGLWQATVGGQGSKPISGTSPSAALARAALVAACGVGVSGEGDDDAAPCDREGSWA